MQGTPPGHLGESRKARLARETRQLEETTELETDDGDRFTGTLHRVSSSLKIQSKRKILPKSRNSET